MTIVMGLDQHRAQITADWLDTETGEVKRGRVAPFLSRFASQELEGGIGGNDWVAVRG